MVCVFNPSQIVAGHNIYYVLRSILLTEKISQIVPPLFVKASTPNYLPISTSVALRIYTKRYMVKSVRFNGLVSVARVASITLLGNIVEALFTTTNHIEQHQREWALHFGVK